MYVFPLFENDVQEGFVVTPQMIAATAQRNKDRKELENCEAAYRLSQREGTDENGV